MSKDGSIFLRRICSWILVVWAAHWAGCQRVEQERVFHVSDVGVAPAGELLDGFEGPDQTVWAFDSADDEADASYVTEGKTQGQKAMRVALRKKGLKGKIQLRREVALDLSGAEALIIDVTCPEGYSLALAFKSDPGDFYQESKPVALRAGLNKQIRFPLAGPTWKSSETNWTHSAPPVNLKTVKRLILLLFTAEHDQGEILFDNLQVDGPAGGALREWRPEIVASTRLTTAEQFMPQEIEVTFRASYSTPFDRRDIDVGLRVRAPSGKRFDVHGFFAGMAIPSKKPKNLPDEGKPLPPNWGPRTEEKAGHQQAFQNDQLPLWLVRFTPTESGRYTTQLWVRNKVGETRLAEEGLVVAPQNSAKAVPGIRGGPVRISRRDPRQLELEDGSPFFLFGQNVAWTTDWEFYLKRVAAYGGNCCRIWLCPWGLNLERKTEPGVYDLETAERIDALIGLAEKFGVRIIFCFTYHGAVGDFWQDTPYALENGGPCARREDFFRDHWAKEQFRGLLQYCVSRWGASPALLAWELMNEVDLAKHDTVEDIEKWTAEMASFIKGVDPHNHLVTISTTRPNFPPDIWRLPSVDIISQHGYGTGVGDLLGERLGPCRNILKPFHLAEFGGGWEAETDAQDTKGVRLQAALWITACSPSAGLALPWWWDTQIEAHKLYGRFEAVGRFIKGDDRRGRFREWVRRALPGKTEVEVHGVMDERGARLYLYRPEWVSEPRAQAKKFLDEPLELKLNGVLDGKFSIEYWDAEDGRVFKKVNVTAEDTVLKVELPEHAGSFALKIDRSDKKELSIGD